MFVPTSGPTQGTSRYAFTMPISAVPKTTGAPESPSMTHICDHVSMPVSNTSPHAMPQVLPVVRPSLQMMFGNPAGSATWVMVTLPTRFTGTTLPRSNSMTA